MPFTNPLVAGTTLIRNAIQSPNYVAGVSGWAIMKDGSAEFNNVVVRGDFKASGSDGSFVEVIHNAPGAAIVIKGDDFVDGGKAGPNATMTPAQLRVFAATDVGHRMNTELKAASFTGSENTYIRIYSEPYEGSASAFIDLVTDTNDLMVTVYGQLNVQEPAEIVRGMTIDNGAGSRLQDESSHTYMRGESNRFTKSWSAVSSWAQTVTFSHTFQGIPTVYTNMESTAGGTAGFITRAWNITTTGFTFSALQAAGTTMTASNIVCSWQAIEPT